MNKLLVFSLLMVCQLICCLALAIISPFFPPFAHDHGISEDVVGIIFSANPLGAIIASLILGKILTENNRFKFMISALILQACGLFLFGLTKFETSSTQIIATGIAARLVNGFATSCFMTPLYAYIPILFPESIEQKVSIAEVFAALGFLLGPVVGSLLYSLGGYLTPFLVFGCIALLLVPLIGCYFAQLRNAQVNEANEANAENEVNATTPLYNNPQPALIAQGMLDPDTIPLDYFQVLKIYPVLMTAISGLTVNFMFNFFSPIVADFLENTYGASPETIGYYVCVLPATYTVSAIGVGNLKTLKTRYILAGLLLMGIAPAFAGPSKAVTGLDHKLYISLLSFAVLGVAAAPVVIFTVPVLNDYLGEHYPNQPTQCANMASALFNTSTFSGELLAPIIAGVLTRVYSYETACFAMGCFIMVVAMLYIPVIFYKTIEPSFMSASVKKSIAEKKISILI